MDGLAPEWKNHEVAAAITAATAEEATTAKRVARLVEIEETKPIGAMVASIAYTDAPASPPPAATRIAMVTAISAPTRLSKRMAARKPRATAGKRYQPAVSWKAIANRTEAAPRTTNRNRRARWRVRFQVLGRNRAM